MKGIRHAQTNLALVALVATALASTGASADTLVNVANMSRQSISLQVGNRIPFDFGAGVRRYKLTAGQALIVRTIGGRQICGDFTSPPGDSELRLLVRTNLVGGKQECEPQ